MRIYKQRLETVPEQIISVPSYLEGDIQIKILKLQTQNNEPCIWFMTNCDAHRRVKIRFFMTGEEIPNDLKGDEYLGTCLLQNNIVIHAFMKILCD